ncbi:JAB domain-containing protein [Sorangium sp. So ce1335]|uniref:JAB domain-containing protein n=1 Tax=Sorangium sp. So ce1335 TaxID=3133335 RepID=UPI003F60B529
MGRAANHPSGDPTPTHEDEAMTLELRHLSAELHVPLTAHVIVTPSGRYAAVDDVALAARSAPPPARCAPVHPASSSSPRPAAPRAAGGGTRCWSTWRHRATRPRAPLRAVDPHARIASSDRRRTGARHRAPDVRPPPGRRARKSLARSGGPSHPAAATSKAGGLRRAYALRVMTTGRPREPCSLAVAGDHHRGTVGQEPDADA